MKFAKYSKFILLLPVLCIFSFFGCGNANKGYVTISPKEAKELMEKEKNFLIVDVREPDEFKEGHVPNAILLPLGTIEQKANTVLKDKGQLLLVYCRSGRRSKAAAETLVKLGYTQVKEFGGIIDWPYEIAK